MSSFICSKCGEEHFLFGHGGVESAVKTLQVPFLGKVPLELELRQSADAGSPYMANPSFEGRPVARAFAAVAASVDSFFNPNQPVSEGARPGLFSKLFGR